MNKLTSAFEQNSGTRRNPNLTFTENMALTPASTNDAVLDFFAKSGALRGHHDNFLQLFVYAYQENPLLAMKALFYSRDVRGNGQGERDTFRHVLRDMAKDEEGFEVLQKNLELIPFYGRWDDLLVLMDTLLVDDVVSLIASQLQEDINNYLVGKSVSLLAKWLPSVNTSSKETRQLAKALRYHLNRVAGMTFSQRNYRKMLADLRKLLDIPERKMSEGKWEEINYETVPSQAMRIYRNAFQRHDAERYAEFIGRVKKGEATIKTATLSPVQLVKRYLLFNGRSVSHELDETIEVLWDNLYDGGDADKNVLNVCDVSSSMYGDDAITTAIAMTIYTAQRNHGAFQNRFITFHTRPKWNNLTGETLLENVAETHRSPWGGTTDLQAVFDLLLSTAVFENVPQEDMPKVLSIVSDMQFNRTSVGGGLFTNFDVIKAKFRAAGYEMPTIVFWNVRASNGQPVLKDDVGTVLLSGSSQGNFRSLVEADLDPQKMTPEYFMLEVLNSERYAPVTV